MQEREWLHRTHGIWSLPGPQIVLHLCPRLQRSITNYLQDLLEGQLWIRSDPSLSSWCLSSEIKRILNLPSALLSSEQQEDLKSYLHSIFSLQLCIGFFLL